MQGILVEQASFFLHNQELFLVNKITADEDVPEDASPDYGDTEFDAHVLFQQIGALALRYRLDCV
ncbi:hypothetical protein KC19_2G145900 [Ceratodon purpureus]|uniref:Uncharacterized protein n=1 Tax=Ceratodon purpureus TaxID=3225 RepID=A0A8T0IWT8_CERPU|nr:hypothetical protein KC19_2G145900 [Ceratodon purpureus]